VCNSYRRGSRDLELRRPPLPPPPLTATTTCATVSAASWVVREDGSLDPHCEWEELADSTTTGGAPLVQLAELPSDRRHDSRRTLASRRTSTSRLASSSPPSATGSSSPSSTTARSFAPTPAPPGDGPHCSRPAMPRRLSRAPQEEKLGARRASSSLGGPGVCESREDSEQGALAKYSKQVPMDTEPG
jgi:hypothetical protein